MNPGLPLETWVHAEGPQFHFSLGHKAHNGHTSPQGTDIFYRVRPQMRLGYAGNIMVTNIVACRAGLGGGLIRSSGNRLGDVALPQRTRLPAVYLLTYSDRSAVIPTFVL
jgi:hypothetical protein